MSLPREIAITDEIQQKIDALYKFEKKLERTTEYIDKKTAIDDFLKDILKDVTPDELFIIAVKIMDDHINDPKLKKDTNIIRNRMLTSRLYIALADKLGYDPLDYATEIDPRLKALNWYVNKSSELMGLNENATLGVIKFVATDILCLKLMRSNDDEIKQGFDKFERNPELIIVTEQEAEAGKTSESSLDMAKFQIQMTDMQKEEKRAAMKKEITCSTIAMWEVQYQFHKNGEQIAGHIMKSLDDGTANEMRIKRRAVGFETKANTPIPSRKQLLPEVDKKEKMQAHRKMSSAKLSLDKFGKFSTTETAKQSPPTHSKSAGAKLEDSQEGEKKNTPRKGSSGND